MNTTGPSLEQFAPDTFHFYRHALEILQAAKVPFLLGGAYAFGSYTGIARHTKDLDVFLRRADIPLALDVLATAGYHSAYYFSHWLAKTYHNDDFVDLIFSSGNGACPVDEAWFTQAVEGEVLGMTVRMIPAEEMIWQKAYIMERERFDGADVNHLLRARGRQLDWQRLLARFGDDWRVLLGHLIFYGFVYPDESENVPGAVLQTLTARLHETAPLPRKGPVCYGTLISRTQYLPDTESWGYADPRLQRGGMTKEELARWTDAGR